MVSKAKFLGKLPIFSKLYDYELEELAQITDEFAFEAGAPIAYQRDVADRLYIVRSGRLVGRRVDAQGIVQERKFYLPGDYFKDIWLFTPTTHDMTVNAAVDGRLLVIEEEKFLPFLIKHPDILEVLDLSEEARYEAEHTQAALPGRDARRLNLLTDEIVEFYQRRTKWLLFFKIIIPALLWVALIYFAVDLYTSERLGWFFVTLLPIVILTLFMFLLYLDWWNDYFVITNKHLVYSDFALFRFRSRDHKVPIDQVQSVEILRPNIFQTLINVGNARITTASGEGVLVFDYIRNPRRVEETINKLRQRVRAIDAGREQAIMRASIEEHFQAPPALSQVNESDTVDVASIKPRLSLLARIRLGLANRMEENGIITYRKHWFTLISETKWLILIGLISLLITFLVPNIYLAVAASIIGFIDLLFFVWQFEDWRNDTFQVTDRYVIDIDRAPFGFGESRKQAELNNVQNVSADRPGLFQTVFNYGNVNIETAGASADITFENVVNPSRVQSDIFQKREQFSRNQQIQAGDRRRKELAVFIDAYQQASEQNRLPDRRTPTLEDVGEFDEPEALDDDLQI